MSLETRCTRQYYPEIVHNTLEWSDFRNTRVNSRHFISHAIDFSVMLTKPCVGIVIGPFFLVKLIAAVRMNELTVLRLVFYSLLFQTRKFPQAIQRKTVLARLKESIVAHDLQSTRQENNSGREARF